MAHKKQDFRFERDWDIETLKEDWGTVRVAIAVPVDIEIEADHKVINIDNAKKYLENAGNIYRMDCGCRTKMKNCEAPTETCLYWDTSTTTVNPENFEAYNIKQISLEEAYETFEVSHKAGLVHMAYAVDDNPIASLCSCCSCCCAVFSGLLRFGMFKHVLSSESVQVTDTTKCTDCGLCIDSCHFGAREVLDGQLEVNNEMCYGCGLCVGACPEEALKIVAKA